MRSERDVEELIETYRWMVHTTAHTFGGRLAHDPDLLQCGMIGLWRAAEEWDGMRPFHSFAKVCIRHAMMSHLRAVSRWEEPVDLTAAGEESAGGAWDAPDERDLDRAIRDTFPENSREGTVLRELLAGRTKESLARRYGMSRKQVTGVAKRAWKKVDV